MTAFDSTVLLMSGVPADKVECMGDAADLLAAARPRTLVVDMVLTRVPPRADALLKRTCLDRTFQIEGR